MKSLQSLHSALVVSLLALATSCSSIRAADSPAIPLRIETGQAQLFVDDYLIGEQRAVRRTLHQPRKDDGGDVPVLALADEFGGAAGTLEANGTIVYDSRLRKWVMFALAYSSDFPGRAAERVRLYRFTSRDALTWTKGEDGRPQRIDIDLSDPVSGKSASNIDVFSCMYDDTDARFPYKGWLHFANWGEGREGQYYMYSADGMTWHRGGQVLVTSSRTIEQDGRLLKGSGDVSTFFFDKERGRILANLRFIGVQAVEHDNLLRSRAYLFVDRLDARVDLTRVTHAALMPPAAAANGDMPADEYYSSTAWRYESMWLGGLRIWHGSGDYSYSAAGAAFMKLVSSRDGLQWTKVPFPNDTGVPEVFVANGEEGGNGGKNDGGYMTEFSNGPLRIGNELVYYYGASSWGKNQPKAYRVSGGGVFRARLRPDGFVSVDAGTLTTVPLTFTGRELFINSAGPVTVELLNGSGISLGTATMTRDALRQKVMFGGRAIGDLARGAAVRLRFTIGAGGHLYSFSIDSRESPSSAPIDDTH